ncbi:MAG: hypothetical protein IKD74_06080 [Clostridia bacterium]|jgi:hypothetical protein|nr:hypothetical protein [Clostridia bacterium]
MHILVLISAAVTIILAILSKIYSLSIIYPSLMLVLTILLDLISNTLETRKDKKLEKKIEEEIKNK